MNLRRSLSAILFALLFLGVVTRGPQAYAQPASAPQSEKQQDETNLDTQLYLLVATNQAVADVDGKIPVALDAVIAQLRATLPFKNYRLSATLLNRVKNEGRLNLKWIGGPFGPSGAVSASNPSFNEFKIIGVKLLKDAAGQQMVRMEGFGFGVRIPIITSSTVASNAPAMPVINYESTGLNTDISMREGEPVIVGTLNIGPSGDAIILVMSAKRTLK